MKINEFIEKYKKNNGVQTVNRLISVKNYLPFVEKQELVNQILNRCKVSNYGYVQFDETKKYIVFTIEVIKAYTNIEFDEDFNIAITEYDALCEADLLNSIIGTFEGEYKTVLNMIAMRQDYILQGNSIECQIAKFLGGLNDRLDDVLSILSDKFGDFNNINITEDDISKLTNFISELGK